MVHCALSCVVALSPLTALCWAALQGGVEGMAAGTGGTGPVLGLLTAAAEPPEGCEANAGRLCLLGTLGELPAAAGAGKRTEPDAADLCTAERMSLYRL